MRSQGQHLGQQTARKVSGGGVGQSQQVGGGAWRRASPVGIQTVPQGSPNPTAGGAHGALAMLTSNLLWPEHWAVCVLQWTGQGRGFTHARGD